MTHNLDELFPAHVSARYLRILVGRLTETLDSIGNDMNLTRERVRQLEGKGHKWLDVELEKRFPEMKAELQGLMQGSVGVDETTISTVVEAQFPGALEIVLRHYGYLPCAAFDEPLPGWWSDQRDAIENQLRAIADGAPFPDLELAERAEGLGLPSALDIRVLLSRPGSPIKLHPIGRWWVRRTAVNRDAAYLVLLDRGEPMDGDDLALELGVNDHNLKEAMRRDDRFVQIRPVGSWGLVEWNLPGTEHRSALEVILGLLSDQGPMEYEDLVRKTLSIYPVSTWRVSQCMASDQIGRMPDGKVGLTRDGAQLVEEDAPPMPGNVALSGDGLLLAVRLTADYDMMRGSGLPFPRYVGWALGLKHVPSSKSFRLEGSDQEITVSKQLGMLQISSLRKPAQDAGAIEGCTIAVLLRLDSDTARIIHGCDAQACPAG